MQSNSIPPWNERQHGAGSRGLPMYGRQIAEHESSLRAGPAESEYGIIPFGIAVGESGTAGFVR